jgi:hypothetical protein
MTDVLTTCLFTGEPTGGGTREEHTLQRGIGGRFRSRIAASSSFNQATSQVLDAPLVATYALITNALAPLMSAEHQPGNLEVTGAPGDGHLVLAPGAVARLRGVRIEERDPVTGRPTAMSAEDPAVLAALARQVGIRDENLEKTTIRPVASHRVERRQPILSPWVETAVVKAALLTFDHLLGSRPDAFTRSPWLQGVRDAVVAIVRGANPALLIGLTSWGIDYELRATLRGIADRYRPGASSAFENVLLVSAREGANVDLFCLIAGVDLFRFRVCNRWPGPAFNILCGAGMLAGDVPYGPIEASDGILMGDRSEFRSVFEQGASASYVDQVTRRIGIERQRAYLEAVLLVESRADQFVVDRIRELEAIGASTLESALRQRFEHLYADAVPDERRLAFRTVVDGIVALPPEVLQARPGVADPERWLAAYRATLRRLLDEVGLPGLIFEVATNSRPAAPTT